MAEKKDKQHPLVKKFIIFGAIAAAFISIVGAYQIIKNNEIALIPEVEARVQESKEETLKEVDAKLQESADVQMQLGNKVYGDTIRGLNRELRQIRREQKMGGDEIPQDLIDDEENIIEEIEEEQAILDDIKEKLKKRIE